jgi:leucyl/phenylalanyl-tRNA---protein transferase
MTQLDSQSDASLPPPADDAPEAPQAPRSLLDKERWVRFGYEYFYRARDFGGRTFHRALGRAAAVTPEGAVGGLCGMMAQLPFNPESVLFGYAQGLFPMEKRGSIHWMCPDPRCVVPLDKLHVPSRIMRYLKKPLFELCIDRDPRAVLANCADRTETWLSPRVQAVYLGLFELGALHTVEAYSGDRLVGGAFGVALGGVCTIESMFSHEDHASKLCFAHMCLHLKERGFVLADCQYQSPHVERFGAIEMPRDEYRTHVARGLVHPVSFKAPPVAAEAAPVQNGKPSKASKAPKAPKPPKPSKPPEGTPPDAP